MRSLHNAFFEVLITIVVAYVMGEITKLVLLQDVTFSSSLFYYVQFPLRMSTEWEVKGLA